MLRGTSTSTTPVHQDLENEKIRTHIIGSVERGEWDAVVLQTPCSSFSVAQEPAIRTLSEPGGTAVAMPHCWRQYLARGNSHARFSAAVCTAAARDAVHGREPADALEGACVLGEQS